MRLATIFRTSESGTSSPRAMIGLACSPRGVPFAMLSRSMSPVERCGTPYLRASSFACVPFPAPGGPRRITARCSLSCGRAPATSLGAMLLAPTAETTLRSETFVIAHHKLRFKLLHGVHRDTHDDEQRRTAEIERHFQAVENPVREIAVKPGATEPPGQVVEVNARDHPLRQQ